MKLTLFLLISSFASLQAISASPLYDSGELQGLNIAELQPSQALLDNVNGHSSNEANALSNSNQFDQTQLVDQTLYQPQQQQPQVVIIQPAAHALGGRYRKQKRSARRHFKIRYFSGNRH